MAETVNKAAQVLSGPVSCKIGILVVVRVCDKPIVGHRLDFPA